MQHTEFKDLPFAIKRWFSFVPQALLCSKKLLTIQYETLSSRGFEVHDNNGLPQGSFLSPLLFNLCLSDLPEPTSRKFCYADDIALVIQHKKYETCQQIHNSDLNRMRNYYLSWKLVPYPGKTKLTIVHLNNCRTTYVNFAGKIMRSKPSSNYLDSINI